MWHIKNVVVFYSEAKIIFDMWEKLLTRCDICTTFKRAINRPNTDPRLFFSPKLFINWQAFIISEKKILIFSLLCKGVQGKRHKIIINPWFYFTDTRKQLWNCCNIYESTMSITSPLKTITDPLKEIKMIKTDPKKVPSQTFFLLVPNFLRNFFFST